MRLNREGRYDDARRALDGVRRRVADYAGSDVALRGIVEELREDEVQYAAPMPEPARKAAYFKSSNLSRMRTSEGKSRRS